MRCFGFYRSFSSFSTPEVKRLAETAIHSIPLFQKHLEQYVVSENIKDKNLLSIYEEVVKNLIKEDCFKNAIKVFKDMCTHDFRGLSSSDVHTYQNAFYQCKWGNASARDAKKLTHFQNNVVKELKKQAIWVPPAAGFIKLNTDASFIKLRGIGGISGLIRDLNGSLLGGYYRYVSHVTSSFESEALALKEALDQALKLGYQNIEIECDNELIVKILKGDRDLRENGGVELREAIELMKSFKHATSAHVYRKANDSADWLANYAVQYSDERPHVIDSSTFTHDHTFTELGSLLQYEKNRLVYL